MPPSCRNVSPRNPSRALPEALTISSAFPVVRATSCTAFDSSSSTSIHPQRLASRITTSSAAARRPCRHAGARRPQGRRHLSPAAMHFMVHGPQRFVMRLCRRREPRIFTLTRTDSKKAFSVSPFSGCACRRTGKRPRRCSAMARCAIHREASGTGPARPAPSCASPMCSPVRAVPGRPDHRE